MDEFTRRRLVLAGATVAATATAGCGGRADVTVTDASVPAEAYSGDPVTVEATVENRGDAGAETTLALTVDGEAVAERTVDLEGGEETTVEFEHAFEDPGDHDVAVDEQMAGTVSVARAVVVADVTLPAESVPLGSAVPAAVTLRNRSGVTQEATLTVEAGGSTARPTATVEAGGEVTVTAEPHPWTPGEHAVEYELGEPSEQVGSVTVADAWHQFGHGAGNVGVAATSGPTEKPGEAWQFDPLGGLSSSPAVVPDGPPQPSTSASATPTGPTSRERSPHSTPRAGAFAGSATSPGQRTGRRQSSTWTAVSTRWPWTTAGTGGSTRPTAPDSGRSPLASARRAPRRSVHSVTSSRSERPEKHAGSVRRSITSRW
ncbi:hypothetical protein BRC81_04130 [Halobacteriales archaeon QS_1_68_20]|nr:MAG: hypothetical protein BRC81_04130 [Halobacteriales archaeon QS_1_68_20]